VPSYSKTACLYSCSKFGSDILAGRLTGWHDEACSTTRDAYSATKCPNPCATCSWNALLPSKSAMMLWPGCASPAERQMTTTNPSSLDSPMQSMQRPDHFARGSGLQHCSCPEWYGNIRMTVFSKVHSPPLATWWPRSRRRWCFGLRLVPYGSTRFPDMGRTFAPNLYTVTCCEWATHIHSGLKASTCTRVQYAGKPLTLWKYTV
jgi:hypothetical protein